MHSKPARRLYTVREVALLVRLGKSATHEMAQLGDLHSVAGIGPIRITTALSKQSPMVPTEGSSADWRALWVKPRYRVCVGAVLGWSRISAEISHAISRSRRNVANLTRQTGQAAGQKPCSAGISVVSRHLSSAS